MLSEAPLTPPQLDHYQKYFARSHLAPHNDVLSSTTIFVTIVLPRVARRIWDWFDGAGNAESLYSFVRLHNDKVMPTPSPDLFLFLPLNIDPSTPSRVILGGLRRLVNRFPGGPGTNEAARAAYEQAGYLVRTKPLSEQVTEARAVVYLIQNDPAAGMGGGRGTV
jgi:hypothetical protein